MVGDEERAIDDALNALRHRCTYVFTTGGIGPTHGDITADCGEGVRCSDRHRSARSRHPARMVKTTGAKMNETRPAPDAHPQVR